ncbi:MAG: aminotransferase class V-fold PLP-dependent enzyme [Chloroflexi bacterium]|nr:aminotransferase class V-fold PLP-dependent enzyme [Chloroflexota bacterium]
MFNQNKIQMIRAAMPAVTHAVYLNTGTNGPLPRRAYEALVDYARDEFENGRTGQPVFDRFMALMSETRGLVAELLSCAPEEIALTHNTTEGMNIALLGLDWRAGDELVTANTEHEGGLNPAALLKARYGVNVIYTDIGLCDCDPLASLERALTPRTKAVVLSHASWSTGAILPMRELCEMAHRVGALVICDAAQACGMVPSRVHELGVDAYAISGQKWLCGPDGTGALFVRRELLPKIQNTFTGYWGLKTRVTRAEAEIEFVDTAMRYQYASHYFPSLKGFAESLKWIRDEIGWEWVYRRTRELGQSAYDALSKIGGVKMYMPRAHIAGLLHFTVDGIAPTDLTAKLYEQNIIIRHVPEPLLNRAATGFYNDEQDIERLVNGIRALVK